MFAGTGGGDIMIKGYDPVIAGGKCVTTFMAVEPGSDPKVYPNFIEFEATPAQGGTLCHGGKCVRSTAAPPEQRPIAYSSRTACFADRREIAPRRATKSPGHRPGQPSLRTKHQAGR